MEQGKLTDEQRLYLQMIFDYFHEHGKWPTYSYLERAFHEGHPELDLDEIVESLPPGLSKPLSAFTFSPAGSANEEAILTVPGALAVNPTPSNSIPLLTLSSSVPWSIHKRMAHRWWQT
jgi:hypothetical protein